MYAVLEKSSTAWRRVNRVGPPCSVRDEPHLDLFIGVFVCAAHPSGSSIPLKAFIYIFT